MDYMLAYATPSFPFEIPETLPAFLAILQSVVLSLPVLLPTDAS